MNLIDWYNGLILVGLLLSIPHFFLSNKFKTQHLIIFIILLVSNILELYGEYTSQKKINNMLAYNIFFVYGETFLILWFFNSSFEEKRVKTILKTASLLFLFWGIIFSILTKNFEIFHTYSFSIGSFLIILCCIYFFFCFSFNDRFINKSLFFNPLFWITTFIFFFYSTTFLYFSAFNLLSDLDKNLIVFLAYLKRIMAVIMYLGMGLAFYLPMVFKQKSYS